jgi:hypothetical protein
MLAAEFALAVTPPRRGHDGGDTRVHPGGVDRDGGTETAAQHGDAIGINIRVPGEEAHGVSRVADLFETDEAPRFALAVAAAAHVEAQRDVAESR